MSNGAGSSRLRAWIPHTVGIPAGAFRMGATGGRDDERPVHEVEVQAFRIAVFPLTRREYAPFLEQPGTAAPPWWSTPGFSSDNQPVVGLTWFDAVAFAAWLSRESGERWRLPTEAEWERATRGGIDQARTPWGDILPAGVIPEGALSGPWEVGRGLPNAYGLHDPGTVVHEWCSDWYDAAYYAASPRLDPPGPLTGGRRASRGGSWRHHVRWSPPSARSSLPPSSRYADYGVRLVCEVPSSSG